MIKNPFVPYPLPPRIKGGYSHEFTNLVGSANRAIGRLDGLSMVLPNPKLLSAPFLRKEAVQSSSIEGTQATLEDVYKHELSVEEHPRAESDVREVVNYINAMELGLGLLKELPISIRLAKEIHSRLLQGVRGQDQRPGEFRIIQNYIAPPGAPIEEASYIPPEPKLVPKLMSDWEIYVNDESAKDDPLVKCGLMHYQFEAIHPFRDGNGRVGRLLITLFLYSRGLITYPILYPSGYFEENRDNYYSALRGVSERGDWMTWLKFFLEALKTQAELSRDKGEKILALSKNYEDNVRMSLSSRHAIKMVELIFVNPFITADYAAKRLRVPHQTAARILKQFVGLGFLTPPVKVGRSKIYKCRELVSLLR